MLENFQWKSSEDALVKNKENIKHELADVMIYAIMMANELELDIEEIILEKLEINRLKYPVEKYKGKSSKSREIIDGDSES